MQSPTCSILPVTTRSSIAWGNWTTTYGAPIAAIAAAATVVALPAWPGTVVTSLGAVSIAASVHALHRHDALLRDTKSAGGRAGAAVSLAPVFALRDQAGRKPAAGAALSVQF